MAPWQEDLNGTLWRSMFYTQFTTVRTAILMPILILYTVYILILYTVILYTGGVAHAHCQRPG
jgi:hypothetical protein